MNAHPPSTSHKPNSHRGDIAKRDANAAQYRHLIEHMTTGFALHQMIYGDDGSYRDYRFLEINPAFETLTGLKANDLLGRTVKEALPETEDHWIETYGEVARTGTPIEYENYSKALNKYFRVWAFRPVPHQFAVIFSDITDHRQMEARLRETQAAAEAATQAKNEFLANMSHEIRTPMNGIIGMTDLLLASPLSDEQRQFAQLVRNSGESLMQIINDLLDYARIDAHKLRLENQIFHLRELLEDLTETLALPAHEKKLELMLTPDPRIPDRVVGDPGRIRQVLLNLIGNAIKFTPEGDILVRASLVDETEDRATIRFTVQDTGIGIPSDKQNILFDKFTQVDPSATRRYGGCGLGLAISKQMVTLMRGTIGVDSEVGAGSTFWFTISLQKQPAAASASPLPQTAPSNLECIRVLIVDDNATNRDILTRHALNWGMRPTQAENGPSALAHLYGAIDDTDPFQLAVIDLQMPGMNGAALGAAIRADSRHSATQLVLLTDMKHQGDARYFADIGFSGYLAKPVRQQDLRCVLSQALDPVASVKSAVSGLSTRHSIRESMLSFAKRKGRVLLAEDDITNQQVARTMLEKLGLHADVVSNGQEALIALKTHLYDMILMDVQMPVMNGLEATRCIRNMQGNTPKAPKAPEATAPFRHPSQVPIIAITAHAFDGDRERCLAAGMDDYISKPVSHLSLTKMLNKWLMAGGKNDDEETTDNTPHFACAGVIHPDTPIWDKDDLLTRLNGDIPLGKRLIDGYLEDIPKQIDTLVRHLDNDDILSAERQAHTIKGASATVGAERLRALALDMEKAANAGNAPFIRQHIDHLRRELAQFAHHDHAFSDASPPISNK